MANRHGARRRRRRFGHRQKPGLVPPDEDQVAAADRTLDEARVMLADELAIHHRHAPEPPPTEPLGDLEAIAEKAHAGAHLQPLRARRSGIAGRGRACQDALADAAGELPRQAVTVEAEQQDADAGPAVRRSPPAPAPIHARLDAAADHGGGEAGEARRRDGGPAGRGGGDDDRRRGHAERLGEGVVHRDALQRQLRHGSTWKMGRAKASCGTAEARPAGAERS